MGWWRVLQVLFCLIAHFQRTAAATARRDVLALRAICDAFGNPMSLVDWDGDDPCGQQWTGITCDEYTPQNVVALSLDGLDLFGVIPSVIGNLSSLRELWLNDNELSGPIPPEIGSLIELRSIWLNGNKLTGMIPFEFSKLVKLQSLLLLSNNLSGEIPEALGLVGSTLTILQIQYNNFFGRIPSGLRSVPNLRYDNDLVCGKSGDPACSLYPLAGDRDSPQSGNGATPPSSSPSSRTPNTIPASGNCESFSTSSSSHASGSELSPYPTSNASNVTPLSQSSHSSGPPPCHSSSPDELPSPHDVNMSSAMSSATPPVDPSISSGSSGASSPTASISQPLPVAVPSMFPSLATPSLEWNSSDAYASASHPDYSETPMLLPPSSSSPSSDPPSSYPPPCANEGLWTCGCVGGIIGKQRCVIGEEDEVCSCRSKCSPCPLGEYIRPVSLNSQLEDGAAPSILQASLHDVTSSTSGADPSMASQTPPQGSSPLQTQIASDSDLSCECVYPMLVRLRLVNWTFANYLPDDERKILEELAVRIQLVPAQVVETIPYGLLGGAKAAEWVARSAVIVVKVEAFAWKPEYTEEKIAQVVPGPRGRRKNRALHEGSVIAGRGLDGQWDKAVVIGGRGDVGEEDEGLSFSEDEMARIKQQLEAGSVSAANGSEEGSTANPYLVEMVQEPVGRNAPSLSQWAPTAPKRAKKKNALVLPTFVLLNIMLASLVAGVGYCVYRQRGWFVKRQGFVNLVSDNVSNAGSFHSLKSQGSNGDDVEAQGGTMKTSRSNAMAELKQIQEGIMAKAFRFQELSAATGGFDKSHLLGSGGFSRVFKAKLKDGQIVAVKILDHRPGHQEDKEFLMEVELLSRLHHVHLVKLIGYCAERNERLLVYEFLPNGTLREHLNGSRGRRRLHWEPRVCIALGAARGLEYLHEAAHPRVLHRDFKSNNILLDTKWRAKVADFGMAKADRTESGQTSPALTRVLGTFGYFAPEYAMLGRVSTKSDVFSFGVVLLELISGLAPVDMNRPRGQESLVLWATPLLQDPKRVLHELVDPKLKNRFHPEDMQKMALLAWVCLQPDPDARPAMPDVVQVLQSLLPERRRIDPSNSFGMFDLSCGQSMSAQISQSFSVPGGEYSYMGRHHQRCRSCSRILPDSQNVSPSSALSEEVETQKSGSSGGDPSCGSPICAALNAARNSLAPSTAQLRASLSALPSASNSCAGYLSATSTLRRNESRRSWHGPSSGERGSAAGPSRLKSSSDASSGERASHHGSPDSLTGPV
ncbi:hypothetical protein CBR_g37652 [Chara braunii]|uniref:Protein kinase domain-containing protein n=1 Tax=Chara braunii TaxID=69332 RepID=A0A388LNR0_CHABU|nr:hypothetical protein CBR_g37652 [Chara braunii]|eukprot:GBG83853.1 hypothetical protein CBR_g37652 [Chara braunii]